MTNTSDPIPGATSFVEALLRDEEVPGETPARAAIVKAAAIVNTPGRQDSGTAAGDARCRSLGASYRLSRWRTR